jgi:hypothetical protein
LPAIGQWRAEGQSLDFLGHVFPGQFPARIQQVQQHGAGDGLNVVVAEVSGQCGHSGHAGGSGQRHGDQFPVGSFFTGVAVTFKHEQSAVRKCEYFAVAVVGAVHDIDIFGHCFALQSQLQQSAVRADDFAILACAILDERALHESVQVFSVGGNSEALHAPIGGSTAAVAFSFDFAIAVGCGNLQCGWEWQRANFATGRVEFHNFGTVFIGDEDAAVGAEAEAFGIESASPFGVSGQDCGAAGEWFAAGIGERNGVFECECDSRLPAWADQQFEQLEAAGVADGAVVGTAVREGGQQAGAGGIVQSGKASQPIDSFAIFEGSGVVGEVELVAGDGGGTDQLYSVICSGVSGVQEQKSEQQKCADGWHLRMLRGVFSVGIWGGSCRFRGDSSCAGRAASRKFHNLAIWAVG